MTQQTDYSDGGPVEIAWITDTHLVKRYADDPGRYENEVGSIPPTDQQNPGPRLYYTVVDKLHQFTDTVNDDRPDLAIHTGDTIGGDSRNDDYERFLEEWNRIDDDIRTKIVRGNHDRNDDFVTMAGYDKRTEVAHSVFNQTFTIDTGNAAARIITYDSHLTDDGQFVYDLDGWSEYGYAGQAPDSLLDWLRAELLATEEETILLFSHVGPHISKNGYFDPRDAQAFSDMIVEDVLPEKPETRICNLFGHFHGELEITEYSQVFGADASDWPGYCNAAAVHREQSSYGIVTVSADGRVSFENRPIAYPFESE